MRPESLGRCEGSAGSDPLQLGARRAGYAPRPLLGKSELIGCTVVRPDHEHFQEAVEGHGIQRQSSRSSLRTGGGAVPHAREQTRVQRFLAGDNPRSLGGCSAVTPEAGLTLYHPLSTARFINTVAGRLPLSAQRPAHSEFFISLGPIAKRRLRLPKGGQLV